MRQKACGGSVLPRVRVVRRVLAGFRAPAAPPPDPSRPLANARASTRSMIPTSAIAPRTGSTTTANTTATTIVTNPESISARATIG